MKCVAPGKRSQGLTEYAAVLGLVACLLIGAVRRLGNSVEAAFNGSAARLASLDGADGGSELEPWRHRATPPSGGAPAEDAATDAPAEAADAPAESATGPAAAPHDAPVERIPGRAVTPPRGILTPGALPPDAPPPVAPLTGSLKLSWGKPTTNAVGGPANLAGYKLYVGVRSGVYGDPIVVPVDATSYELTGLERGRRYYFVLTAYSASGGESAPSTEVSKTVPLEESP